ncbi:hypothetical protein [Bifidobacterium boum]|uniref:NADH-quinone oxidoreductase subunit M n=1 Tax=Bifidobacterium boum TaxID=78343 RepID=A0A086ZKI2_9BIFI|nr:hypothetical protein [Bifidobacterium boum]KFI47032.1 NADH-quinone oxidoreductase subunit M [Bifidobacterium boum]
MEAMEKLIGSIAGIVILIWICWKLFTAFLPRLFAITIALIIIKTGVWMYKNSREDEDQPYIDTTAEPYNE